MAESRRAFLVRALAATAVAFVALGLVLPLAIDTPPFALYRDALEAEVGRVEPRTRMLLLGITGGSIAGKWVAHLALVGALARGERWARRASLAGLASWFVLDSAVSLAHGAWWNVAYVNVVPLVTFGALVAMTHGADTGAPPEVVRGSPAWWALLAAAIGATSGLVIALGGSSALFEPWRAALGEAHHGGPLPSTAARFAATFFGPIGGSTFAQFLILGALARERVSRGDLRALDWTLASFFAWFVPDCAWSLGSGGLFNVLLVNLPFAAVLLPPLAWARWKLARSG
jgi:hypothetical protein